ncbi:ABC transporter substrate-binding protein [Pectinatus cerevisiiphilus]|uniref:Iron complex transport system substrate-binding protein n=1 Tax=Pectinatus cerevisiiphilus TaxID=86956 RepID=A0A4R3KFR5_9FIRM|nr:ABC transporter substrate-binding protein [Pectinatus cerevisiiphilus]TCS82050.1 iron complex transport system substrate-binding protein [Pectinatus cerevisiiphilus]
MGKKALWGFLVCMMAVVFMAGCGDTAKDAKTESYLTIEDDAGRTVTLAKKPERIVALSTSFLEPLHEVDATVVGCPSSKMGIPDYYKDVEKVGAVYNINIEKVVSLQPDLVIAMKGMNDKFVANLESNNIPVIVLDMKSYDQVKHSLDIFSQITGEQDKAKGIIAAMDKKIEDIKGKLPQETKRVAILHSTAQDVTVQLDDSIAGSVAKMLGFVNVAADTKPLDNNPDAAPYSLEALVKEDPDVIFVTSMGDMQTIKKAMQDNVENNSAWQTLRAVKENHVYYLPQKLFLLNPGMHYPEAVETMAKELYPQLFTEDK